MGEEAFRSRTPAHAICPRQFIYPSERMEIEALWRLLSPEQPSGSSQMHRFWQPPDLHHHIALLDTKLPLGGDVWQPAHAVLAMFFLILILYLGSNFQLLAWPSAWVAHRGKTKDPKDHSLGPEAASWNQGVLSWVSISWVDGWIAKFG